MEIILREEDLKTIINKYYSNVSDIKFSGKNPKVTLIMKTAEPVESVPVTVNTTTAKPVASPTRQEPKKGVMGTERRIIDL